MDIYKGLKVTKRTFEEDIKIKQAEFLALKPEERLRNTEELTKRIFGEKYRYRSLRGMKVVKRKLGA